MLPSTGPTFAPYRKASNAWNYPSFAPVSTSTGAVNGTDSLGPDKLSSGTFGDFTARQAGEPRAVPLALKLFF